MWGLEARFPDAWLCMCTAAYHRAPMRTPRTHAHRVEPVPCGDESGVCGGGREGGLLLFSFWGRGPGAALSRTVARRSPEKLAVSEPPICATLLAVAAS